VELRENSGSKGALINRAARNEGFSRLFAIGRNAPSRAVFDVDPRGSDNARIIAWKNSSRRAWRRGEHCVADLTFATASNIAEGALANKARHAPRAVGKEVRLCLSSRGQSGAAPYASMTEPPGAAEF
jgi:hypothetical protein